MRTYEDLDAPKPTREEAHEALESLIFTTTTKTDKLKAENVPWVTSNKHSMDTISLPGVLLL